MREKLLIKIAYFADRRAGLLFLITVLVTIIAAALSSKLELTMHFKNLMPQDHPMVKEFNNIIEDYNTASMIIVAATGEEKKLKQFADELAPRLNELKQYVQRIDYKLEKDFYINHGLMLQKAKDLDNLKDIYMNLNLLPLMTNLNNSFEKEYVWDEESLSSSEKEDNAVRFLDNIKYWLETMENYAVRGELLNPDNAARAVNRFLIGDEYMISPDKDMILLFAQPAFTINEMDKVIEAENTIDAIVAEIAGKYPGIFAGTTGTMALSRDETEAASQDMYVTSIIAFLLIIALFIISFRMWVAPLLAGISLVMGIIWTAGFAALTLGSLNMMTSMFSVILIGLGVDFSIHIISVYTENRARGNPVGKSLRFTLLKSGNGIITGGLTTASAFFTLTVSKSAGMSEFGIVAGSGVIFCMLATILALPAMLSLRDKMRLKFLKDKTGNRPPEFRFLGKMSSTLSKRPLYYLTASSIVSAILLFFALNITFDYNYLNMEPEGLTSIKLQDRMIEEFDVTPDFALITTSSVEESRHITEKAKDLKMVGMVSSISEYIPSPGQQQKRLPIIREIRDYLNNNKKLSNLNQNNFDRFIDELKRLEANIIELAQLAFLGGQDKVDRKTKEIIGNLEDPDNVTLIEKIIHTLNNDRSRSARNLNIFRKQYEPVFRRLSLSMASEKPITLKIVPESIRNQFENKDGDKFLVTIYPREQVWNLAFLDRFTDQMQKLDPRVTGIPPVFYVLIDIIGRDGKVAALLTIIVVFLLLSSDFRSFRLAATALVPLIVGAIWMVGSMTLLGLQLTLVNVMGIPLILGIGIDDGVHILHRYRVEGMGKIKTVFTSTGKAVMLTSLTTMLAFGSLKFATYRGLGSLGVALFLGVGMCFLTSVIILPSLLKLLERRKKDDAKMRSGRKAQVEAKTEVEPQNKAKI